jgi:uncharacterized protein (TIGR00299 family) protein
MHLHLDLVGGISGDMFVSAVLDCYPQFATELNQQMILAGFPDMVKLESGPFNDGVLSGHRFKVHPAEDAHGHHHRHYSEIKLLLANSKLSAETKVIAEDIFFIIAEAEAAIHDKPIEDIAFHEVGAWDSIADIVCASYLIAQLKPTSCSCSALPLGGGQVKTAHGMLPIPAPATALILRDFEFVDDGISGERITPTGAAILKYLSPGQQPKAKLSSQGFGFGTKKFPGISNTLRLLILETEAPTADASWGTEQIHQVEFEIDDQTPEQLAAAIEKLQSTTGVLDVVQYGAYGKKQRLTHAVRILSSGEAIDVLLRECFALTTTLGLRHSVVQRYSLQRENMSIHYEEKDYSVKIANRPGGKTSKVEMDDLTDVASFSEQGEIRRQVETLATDNKG